MVIGYHAGSSRSFKELEEPVFSFDWSKQVKANVCPHAKYFIYTKTCQVELGLATYSEIHFFWHLMFLLIITLRRYGMRAIFGTLAGVWSTLVLKETSRCFTKNRWSWWAHLPWPLTFFKVETYFKSYTVDKEDKSLSPNHVGNILMTKGTGRKKSLSSFLPFPLSSFLPCPVFYCECISRAFSSSVVVVTWASDCAAAHRKEGNGEDLPRLHF